MNHSNPSNEHDPQVGLLACGRCGDWEVSVDDAISGPERWFAQLEGPSVYLYFEIEKLRLIEEMLRFFEASEVSLVEIKEGIRVGTFNESTVLLLKDDEFSDRYFFCIGGKDSATLRITIAGEEIHDLSTALRQIRDELKSNE